MSLFNWWSFTQLVSSALPWLVLDQTLPGGANTVEGLSTKRSMCKRCVSCIVWFLQSSFHGFRRSLLPSACLSLQAFEYNHSISWWKSIVWFWDVKDSSVVDEFIVIFSLLTERVLFSRAEDTCCLHVTTCWKGKASNVLHVPFPYSKRGCKKSHPADC